MVSPFRLLCISQIMSFTSLVYIQQLPQPPYSQDLFLNTISFILPFLLVLAFLYSAGVFVKVTLCGVLLWRALFVKVALCGVLLWRALL